MPDRDAREVPPDAARPAPLSPKRTAPADEKVLCERCGAEMFRMHAVWRCPACGYKTDCCGW
jgi:rubrerythrin